MIDYRLDRIFNRLENRIYDQSENRIYKCLYGVTMTTESSIEWIIYNRLENRTYTRPYGGIILPQTAFHRPHPQKSHHALVRLECADSAVLRNHTLRAGATFLRSALTKDPSRLVDVLSLRYGHGKYERLYDARMRVW